eukprot:5183317-Pyramimonas_sp.AAC.1
MFRDRYISGRRDLSPPPAARGSEVWRHVLTATAAGVATDATRISNGRRKGGKCLSLIHISEPTRPEPI